MVTPLRGMFRAKRAKRATEGRVGSVGGFAWRVITKVPAAENPRGQAIPFTDSAREGLH